MAERVALVTGSGRGIGRAIAVRLASDGYKVLIGDLRADTASETAELVAAAGGTGLGVALDVTDAKSIADVVGRAEQDLGGPVDVVVNNAGWDEHHKFVETDEAFWDRVIDINYKGVLRVTAAVLPGMMERGWGRVINIGSDAGRVGSSLEAVYAGAKGGVIAFTKTIAREAARSGVTANVVCPGPTETPLLAEITASAEDAAKVIAAMTRAVPMKRLGKPEELAAAVAFFAREDAGFITGQTLSVSGGLTMA
jgi:2-hydroxycyclohexanecarboxyl-CoA dehydrogenase